MEYSKGHFTCEVIYGQVIDERYTMMDGVIYYRNRILLTTDSKLKKKILHAAHEALLFGHMDFMGAYQAIMDGFSWEGVKEDVHDPGGYRWPPTYSIWTYTINSCSFSHSLQLNIFSRFLGPKLSKPFWGLNHPSGYWWQPTYSI